MTDDTDDGESAESETSESNSADSGDESENGYSDEAVTAPGSETMRAMEEGMQDLIDESARERVYGTAPILNLENIVVDYTTVNEDFSATLAEGKANYVSVLDKNASPEAALAHALKQWEATSGKTVANMVKQFELKKNADISKRAMISKTGVLDTVKMVDYRWSEDIFRKHTVLPKGKNHGVMMFIDWSGSMHHMIGDTLRQLMTLASFCRRVNIPFEAYAFTSSYSARGEDRYASDSTLPPQEKDVDGAWRLERRFHLLNLLSSRAKNREWNKLMANCLWMIDYFEGNSEIFHWSRCPRGYDLGSTPLDPAILAASQMVPEFQSKYALQIVNTFFLTDGATSTSIFNGVRGQDHDWLYGSDCVLKKGSRTWTSSGRRSTSTETMLRYLADTTGSKVMGMFLQPSKRFYHENEQVVNEFQENKCVELGASYGYDNYFLLDPTKGKGKSVADLDDDASPTVVRNAFIRQAKTEKAMRNLMSRIAECVALDRF